jgi:glycosyltransferase involved in cell wall biosynthesis
MKVVGFTFIRNAITYDYPIVEAIESILPLCSEVIVAVGNSDDDTLALVQQISPKVRTISTTWDDSLREGGKVLAEETNKAIAAIPADADWCVYIQGDEVMHEAYYNNVTQAMERYKDNDHVDGLLFNYRHFYGSYDYIGDAISWYPKEIRVIKNNHHIFSYRDAQGFRKEPNEKLNVVPIEAYIHHYGWVKSPAAIQSKKEHFQKLWHNDEWIEENVISNQEIDTSEVSVLYPFEGNHPKVMEPRIQKQGWKFEHDISKNTFTLKQRIKKWVQKVTGLPLGEYQNYNIIK